MTRLRGDATDDPGCGCGDGGRGLAGRAGAEEPVKVGWVYVGPVGGDFGWSYQHDQGRKAVEKALGDKVETSFVENVPEGPDAERVIRQLATSGNQIVFTTSFGFMNPTIKVAKQFPKTKFEHATGYKTAPNVAHLQRPLLRGPRGARHVAGQMTKTNMIGYIASFPIPEVVMGINAFTRARAASTRTPRSRSSGSTPGTTRARRPTPPRR